MDDSVEYKEDIDEENWWEIWYRRRRMAVVQVLCYAVYVICIRYFYYYHQRQYNEAATTAVKGKKRKARAIEREFEGIRKAIKDVARAIREGNDVVEGARQRVYAEEEVFNELVEIGAEKHLRFTAYTFLVEDPARARAFFGYPFGERKDFLLQMMFGPEDP